MVDDSLIKGDIVFNAKPDAVPYNYRISYKVSQLCLIMRICGWGDSCSLIKLQMISYALFSSETMSHLINYAEGYGPAPIVRFDPAVNRSLQYPRSHISPIKNLIYVFFQRANFALSQ